MLDLVSDCTVLHYTVILYSRTLLVFISGMTGRMKMPSRLCRKGGKVTIRGLPGMAWVDGNSLDSAEVRFDSRGSHLEEEETL